ncbi:BAF-like protein [Mya arenaria]|uniref:BAF-like protein n=1 Tax=Mya arenaria TaxID=6604 RepID=A0ABY7F8Y0_MYAAR|nr:BAF-like protein [Mya arenaria]
MTSRVHRDFVKEPMGNKSATALPGIGIVAGRNLSAAGYAKASNVFGKFLALEYGIVNIGSTIASRSIQTAAKKALETAGKGALDTGAKAEAALWPRSPPSLGTSGSVDLTAVFHNVNKECSGDSKWNMSEQSVIADVSRHLKTLHMNVQLKRTPGLGRSTGDIRA